MRERARAALDGFDLLLDADAGVRRRRRPTSTRSRSASALTRFTFPFNALGWPALALPSGRRGRAAGVGADRRPAAATTALVLAAGLELASSSVGRVNADLEFAHELADAADAITLARFRAVDLRVETKPDLTPVSEADRAAEEAIRALVAASGRGEGVLGEEFGDDGGDAKWIVDPIDGTKNYVRGVPVWATLLALAARGRGRRSALVSAPALGRRWWAIRGEGACANGERVPRLGRRPASRTASVSTTSARGMPRRLAHASSQRAWSNRGLGDFWQHCLVAEGALDVACDPVLKLWDYAAVQLIVEEAGGRCTTFDGDPPAGDASFLATNGALHDEAASRCSASERRLSNV